MSGDKHLLTSKDLTGTSNQNRPQENDIEVEVKLKFSIANDGVKRSHDERLEEIKYQMRESGMDWILHTIEDYKVI